MTKDPDTLSGSDWIQTYTGRSVDYKSMTQDDICIEDIAHALSMECRYGGHTAWHYSVAQHSVHVYDELVRLSHGDEACKQGLMHDAPEAYIKDIMRPLKPHLGKEYKELNDAIWFVIAFKYGISKAIHPSVKHIDLCICLTEKKFLLGQGAKDWELSNQFQPLEIDIPEWSPSRAKSEFLKRFRQEFGVLVK